jgi:hypothetical protein
MQPLVVGTGSRNWIAADYRLASRQNKERTS